MADLLNYFEYLITQEGLQFSHMKALIVLMKKPQTQAEVGRKLGITRENINKVFKFLEKGGYIEVDRIEGRNKFYKVVTDVEKIETAMQGQLKL